MQIHQLESAKRVFENLGYTFTYDINLDKTFFVQAVCREISSTLTDTRVSDLSKIIDMKIIAAAEQLSLNTDNHRVSCWIFDNFSVEEKFEVRRIMGDKGCLGFYNTVDNRHKVALIATIKNTFPFEGDLKSVTIARGLLTMAKEYFSELIQYTNSRNNISELKKYELNALYEEYRKDIDKVLSNKMDYKDLSSDILKVQKEASLMEFRNMKRGIEPVFAKKPTLMKI
ncbi:hypothetical protein [Pseudomonas aeruginosa]|uniref:hypothetical protein n=1 Tax=Pseudomonas aeruginosa TaxID=287 RepID=UPI001042D856|nr:hypothetical protein [Pseudomonas aeruginosa]